MMNIAYNLGKSYTSPCRCLILSSNWVSKWNKLHECQVDPMRCIFETSFPTNGREKFERMGKHYNRGPLFAPPWASAVPIPVFLGD